MTSHGAVDIEHKELWYATCHEHRFPPQYATASRLYMGHQYSIEPALHSPPCVTPYRLLPCLQPQIACASFSSVGSWLFFACRSELPPMCFLSMKMFGTDLWFVISCRASWIAAPSSTRLSASARPQLHDLRLVVPTWSSSMMYGFAPISLSSDLVALQYGQYDLLKTATELLSMMSCALVFAAMMLFGLAGLATLKKVRRKFVLGNFPVVLRV